MNVERAMNDLLDLCEYLEYYEQIQVSWDLLDSHRVIIKGVQIPASWERITGGPRGTLLFELPDSYPAWQPMVYIREHDQFDGPHPIIMEKIEHEQPWVRLHIFIPDWDSDVHNLITLFQCAENDIKQATSSNKMWSEFEGLGE